MTAKLRSHLRANVVGYIALMIAVAGVPTAWALARNSVGSPQLKRGAVKTSDIANGAVNSSKVQNRSLQAHDLTVLPTLEGGATETVVTARFARKFKRSLDVHCKAGEQLLGGGGSGTVEDGFDLDSYPVDSTGSMARNSTSADGWHFGRSTGEDRFTDVFALCARWGRPGEGRQGPPGPPGPPGTIADQVCPENEFVRGFSEGQINCAPAFSP
jgi:hypothetical protein